MTVRGNKHFYSVRRESLYVGIGGGYDDVNGGEEKGVSKANIFVSIASKLSAGDRIFRGP